MIISTYLKAIKLQKLENNKNRNNTIENATNKSKSMLTKR